MCCTQTLLKRSFPWIWQAVLSPCSRMQITVYSLLFDRLVDNFVGSNVKILRHLSMERRGLSQLMFGPENGYYELTWNDSFVDE